MICLDNSKVTTNDQLVVRAYSHSRVTKIHARKSKLVGHRTNFNMAVIKDHKIIQGELLIGVV